MLDKASPGRIKIIIIKRIPVKTMYLARIAKYNNWEKSTFSLTEAILQPKTCYIGQFFVS
jgi:hypothetical protein